MATLYFFIAFLCASFSYLSTHNRPLHIDDDDVIRKRQRIFFYIVVIVIAVSFSGFRQISVGGMDEYAYRARFDMFKGRSLYETLQIGSEPLISFLYYICLQFSDNSQSFLLLSSAVTLIPIFRTFSKYSIYFPFAVLLLFVTGQFYSMFNGIAQYLAAAIYLFAIPYIQKRQFWKYVLVVAICCSLHIASAVLIPIYFLATNKINSTKNLIMNLLVLSAIIVAYTSLEQIINATGMLENYMFVAVDGHHGVKLVTILINCVPAALAIYTSKRNKGDILTTIFGNMCILHALIYIASSMDVYIARFALFTCTFPILFLSRATQLFEPTLRKILKVCSVLLYSVVCYLIINEAQYTFNFDL